VELLHLTTVTVGAAMMLLAWKTRRATVAGRVAELTCESDNKIRMVRVDWVDNHALTAGDIARLAGRQARVLFAGRSLVVYRPLTWYERAWQRLKQLSRR
jgi:hypothetical protein